MNTEKKFKMNFDATIKRLGRRQDTQQDIVVGQTISEIVGNALSRLHTFTEVEKAKPIIEKALAGGYQDLDTTEFAIVYSVLQTLNTDEKTQVLKVLPEIDFIAYESEK